MALNPNVEGKRDTGCTETGDLRSEEGGECMKTSSSIATSSATSNQNGDQTGCGDRVMPEQEAPDRRRSGQADARMISSSGSSLPGGPKPGEELPRRNFQIPRKIKERKGLYQFLPQDSREFEDLAKILSSFYLDSSSRATFSYCKARLIHNELLEKEFIEKRREMKQEGRTEQELAESYCFLFPDKSKLQWICEKGLSFGHSRIASLGNPAMGVYLSKFSDLLQINPFEVGTSGDMIVFKVMRGRLKQIFENMPKNAMEPTPKFDCHVSKNANRVTSLLSYRGFELTQQYFFEFAFDEIKARPRHALPYAVVSFQYKGKDAALAPMTAHRFNSITPEGSRGKSCYTVWSGPLLNKGHELFHVCLRSSTRPYLPFKLPYSLEVSRGMQLDQVKRKIPSVLFSWDTYSVSREVMKCGMSCSLFEVADGKGKPTKGSLSALVHKLERDRMVLVKPLTDKGFLFLLSSTQMTNPNDRRVRIEKGLQALFIFQEARVVVKHASTYEPDPLSLEPQPALLSSLEPFVPALHYALLKLRPNPGPDLSAGAERQAHDYLTRRENGTVRPFIPPEYKQNLDERGNLHPAPRPKPNLEGLLRSYVQNPAAHILPLAKARAMMDKIQNPPPPPPPPLEYSPVSDWGGSDRGSDRPERPPPERPAHQGTAHQAPPHQGMPADSSRRRPGVSHSNGAQPQQQQQHQAARQSQSEYDKDKVKQLLKLIQLRKKTLKEPGQDRGEGGPEDAAWDPHSLKRKLEGEYGGAVAKHLRTDPLTNGEPSRGAQADEASLEGVQGDNLTAVMESMGIYDTDLRAPRSGAHSSSVNETQRLLKILLATLNKAMSQGVGEQPDHGGEPSAGAVKTEPGAPDPTLRKPEEPPTNYTEEDMDCSPGSPCSLGSPANKPHSSDNPPWSKPPTKTEKAQPIPEPVADVKPVVKKEVPPVAVEVKKAPAPRLAVVEESPQRPSISLDTILNQEVHSLTSDIKSIMHSHHIYYNSVLPPRLPRRQDSSWRPCSSFSEFVVPYVTSVNVQGHVKALCAKMDRLIPSRPAPKAPKPPKPPKFPASSIISSLPLPPALASAPKTKGQPSQSKSSSSSSSSHGTKLGTVKASTRKMSKAASGETGGGRYSPSHVTMDSPESNSTQNPLATAPTDGPTLLASSLISQLKPEVFSSLVEIFKDVTKNTVKFYIYSGEDGEGSSICKEIKAYLMSLGNTECNPQSFLENSSSMDKLLIIIQNEDIAAHVHKIPALVSLKKLPSVSFAGVDSLDDVKNHTYNELFVSGGFIVSDEFVLNPDLITQERLQRLLMFLEEQNSPEQPWQWKVHCKSQKKLKELCRLNTNAMGLLNLLTVYQKKHLVEFLPYHDCDAQSRQAPDLDCLIKLQAHHTQQRHLIFLTERPFEMFLQYSRNGIVIASIDDIMSGFHGLIGSINQNDLPTPPSTVVNDECVEAEDMSLDSDDGEDPVAPEPPDQNRVAAQENPPQPPPPEAEEFRPPLPEQQAAAGATPTPNLPDYAALKTAISQFKATNQLGPGSLDLGGMSPGGFAVNPHQSFLCPSASWASFTGSSGYSASPAYPASPCSTQEQDYRAAPPTSAPVPTLLTPAFPQTTPPPPLPTATSVPSLPGTPPPPLPTVPGPPAPTTLAPPLPMTTAGPLAKLASFPLAVKPPPPPHLMMLGHMYGSQVGGGGTTALPGKAVGASPLTHTETSGASAAPTGLASLPLEVKPPPPPHLMMLGHMYGSHVGGGGTTALPGKAVGASPLTYTETSGASAAPTGLGFSQSDVTQHSYMTGVTATGTSGSAGGGLWAAMGNNSTCEASSSQGGATPGSGAQGGDRDWSEPPGNGTPGSQGGRTPVNCTDRLGAGVLPDLTTRGGSVTRPNLPMHSLGSGSYGSVGGGPGQMDHGGARGSPGGPGSLGAYRGRGAPPGGPWPRPGRGHERGEGTGGGPPWGYPLGRGRGKQPYYSDYTSHT